MKKGLLSSGILLAGIMVTCSFFACESEKRSDLGKEAAEAFCKCYETKSSNTCLGELKSKYKEADYSSSDFISAFNSSNTCGAELKKVYTMEHTLAPIVVVE